MDSSRSAQRADIQFLRAEGEHTLQIYRRMKEVYGEQVHHIPVVSALSGGTRKHQELTTPWQAHVVTNSATASAVDELIRQNFRIITHEIAVELSISKGTVHHIIHR
ncbi:hypothetical protein AVEN_201316-1 [Araneus ventricosus]|uniref:Uncharacterized protein n=1 Tax=Araneus ventricosus TaxID=182803 RepID=A0A4Y2KG60_ARAVE|nr:hypothetical protein AVEN_201316-1 [Araneus ventricosus]